MRLASGIQYLECSSIKRPELLIPKIEDDTSGCELLQIQEDHKVYWQGYTFQEVIDSVAVKSIVADVDAQYVEQLEEDYIGYKNQNIWTIIKQLQMWYIITIKKNLDIKAHFIEPWSDTPDAYITTFSRQLYRRQVGCKDHGVTVAKAKKWTTSWHRCTPATCLKPIFWTSRRKATTSRGGPHSPAS